MGSVWAAGLLESAKAGSASRNARRSKLRIFTLRFIVLLRSLELLVVLESTFLLMQMIRSDAADLILDAVPGKLYPLLPGNPRVPLYLN